MKREHLKSRGEPLGPCYMIFGSRCTEEGLFHDEIKQFVKNKTLGKCFMAYSREPGKKKEYTSDKIRCNSVRKVLSPVLQRSDTHVFICGSAIMAEESKDALAEITSTDVLKAIETEGRLHCDVFGALAPSTEKKNDDGDDDDEEVIAIASSDALNLAHLRISVNSSISGSRHDESSSME